MKRRFLVGLLSTAIIAGSLFAAPQSRAEKVAEKKPQVISVIGDVAKKGEVDVTALEKLGGVEFEWKHKDMTYHFTGVPLDKVLTQFSVDAGKMSDDIPKTEKLAGLKKVIVATSPDGFQAIFSYAEICAFEGEPTKAFIAWKLDGKPLPDDMGAFRIVVPSDKEGARSLYHLAALQVVDMRQIVEPIEPKN
ncbi:MAG: molybdopterin-dependent oxidoreductase [Candidatus Sumerlaeota bacterium]